MQQKYSGLPGHEWANQYHLMLNTEELVIVRWDEVTEGYLCSGLEVHRMEQEGLTLTEPLAAF